MKYIFRTAITFAAAIMLGVSQPASASDLGLDDRSQVGERGVPQCFESSSRTERGLRHVTESDGPRTQDFAEFRKTHGLESIDRTHARLLEDPEDSNICRALGKKHLDDILKPHEGDPEIYGNVYANDASYYQVGDYYVVVLAEAYPTNPEHLEGYTRVRLGMVEYQITVYDIDLNEVWSRGIAL